MQVICVRASVLLMAAVSSGCHLERVSNTMPEVRIEYPNQAVCVSVPIERGSEWSGSGPFSKLHDLNAFKVLGRYDRFVKVGWRWDFASQISAMIRPYAGGDLLEEAPDARARRYEALVSTASFRPGPEAYESMQFGIERDELGREWVWHSGVWGMFFLRDYYLHLDSPNGSYLAVVRWNFEPIEISKSNFETRRDRFSKVLSSVRLC
jgi:hypothetical protein